MFSNNNLIQPLQNPNDYTNVDETKKAWARAGVYSFVQTFLTQPLDYNLVRTIVKKGYNLSPSYDTTQQQFNSVESNNLATKFKGFKLTLSINFTRNMILFGSIPFVEKQFTKRNFKEKESSIYAFTFGSALDVVFAPFLTARHYIFTTDAKNIFELFTKIDKPIFVKSVAQHIKWGSMRNVVFAYPYMSLVLNADQYITYNKESVTQTLITKFLIGASAGAIATLGSFPVHFVQTNMIENPNRRVFPFMFDVYQKEGLKGFYSGFSTSIKRMAISSGGLFASIWIADYFYHKTCKDWQRSGFKNHPANEYKTEHLNEEFDFWTNPQTENSTNSQTVDNKPKKLFGGMTFFQNVLKTSLEANEAKEANFDKFVTEILKPF